MVCDGLRCFQKPKIGEKCPVLSQRVAGPFDVSQGLLNVPSQVYNIAACGWALTQARLCADQVRTRGATTLGRTECAQSVAGGFLTYLCDVSSLEYFD